MVQDVGTAQREEFLVQQYVKLREEIASRTNIQQQLVAIAVIGAGATLTVGANNSAAFGIPVLLVYPVLVMFLAIAWSTQYATIRNIGAFIARLEDRVFLHGEAVSLGWESILRRGPFSREPSSALVYGWLDAKGIFVGIQALSLALAVARSGISVEAFSAFFHHPHVIRPYLWSLSLGVVDLAVLSVTLSLPRMHPSMRQSVFQLGGGELQLPWERNQ